MSVGTAFVLLGSIILGTQGLVSANKVTAIQEPATTINQASASHSTTEEAQEVTASESVTSIEP